MGSSIQVKYDRVVDALTYVVTLIDVSNHGISKQVKAFWDTGATHTVVTKTVVDILNLNTEAKEGVILSMGGIKKTFETCVVGVLVDATVCPLEVTVDEIPLEGCDCILGMDIITKGNFQVSTVNEITQLKFELP